MSAVSEEETSPARRVHRGHRLRVRRWVTGLTLSVLLAVGYCAVGLGAERRNLMLAVLAALFATTSTLSHLNNLFDRLWPPEDGEAR